MKNVPTEATRTIALAGHGSTGKTTLIERMLFKAGMTTRIGSIDNGTSICDYQDDEKQRKISLNSKLISFSHAGLSLFLLDTPGYADFFGDTVSALHVADCTLIVIDASQGIQVGTMKVWKELERESRPRAIFINKLDKDQADFQKTIDAIQEVFGAHCVMMQLPVGRAAGFTDVIDILTGKGLKQADPSLKKAAEAAQAKLSDAIAETDDTLLEKYLAGTPLTADEITHGFQHGVANGSIIPILCGSASTGVGIDLLLDTLEHYFPSPLDLGPVLDKDGKEKREPNPKDPFSAFVFKTLSDPFIGHLTYFRIYSGTVTTNTEIYIPNKNQRERLGHLFVMRGKEQIPIEEASAGDIVVVPKLKYATVNDTFCCPQHPIMFEPTPLPQPSLSFSIHPKNKGDEEKIATGLHKLCEDDPTLRLVKNAETKEMVLSGLGDLHITVMLERLKAKFHVDVEIGKPKVAYKETCKTKAKGHEKHKKQSGGRGQYGEVYLEVAPKERGSGFEFIDNIVGGSIPRNFLPAVEKGIQGAMTEGILAGYPVVDISASAYDGSFHPVDSCEIAFKVAGAKAFKEAFLAAHPVLLEPILNLEVTVPDELTGSVIGDLNGKRGRVQGMDTVGHMQVIKAQVPHAELFTYSNELRSMTGGRGSFTIEFSHYEEVPSHLAQKIIAESKAAREKEMVEV